MSLTDPWLACLDVRDKQAYEKTVAEFVPTISSISRLTSLEECGEIQKMRMPQTPLPSNTRPSSRTATAQAHLYNRPAFCRTPGVR